MASDRQQQQEQTQNYQQQQQQHHQQMQQRQNEFLPLCDVLFNIISLTSYFCDVVFDLAMAYALFQHPLVPSLMFPLNVTFVIVSLIVSQLISIKWYLWGTRGKLRNNENQDCDINGNKKTANWTLGCVLFLHMTQVGVLWRYFKLFIPVDLAYVKHEVRELCILRLIHGFCEAAPMLLLQVYLLAISPLPTADSFYLVDTTVQPAHLNDTKLAELTSVSAGLSLWSVCWAVASFSKGAARLRNLERLVLTWLGVLAQLFWRLGTVSARVGALVAYASIYGPEWMLVVMGLHWLSMLTWLMLTPDGLFNAEEKLAFGRKSFIASMLAFIYVFAYINLHETNHRQRMVIFYSVMFLENSLLMGVWAVGVSGSDIQPNANPVSLLLTLLGLFFGGLFFMSLYYRFFHVRRLQYDANGTNQSSSITTLSQNVCNEKYKNCFGDKKNAMNTRKTKLSNSGIPGVFSCRFASPAVTNLNRKKKKPTSFVPPPTQIPMSNLEEPNNKWANNNTNGPQLIPFWKRPLPIPSINNDNESTRQKNESDQIIGSSLSVNLIHEKLRAKKQQQLRELRTIQEEIKEGKIIPPLSTQNLNTNNYNINQSTINQQEHQQPPPNSKLHTSPTQSVNYGGNMTSWPPVKMHCLLMPSSNVPNYYRSPHPTTEWEKNYKKECDNSEILLKPKCLPGHYVNWAPHEIVDSRLRNDQKDFSNNHKVEDDDCEEEASDFEGSQVSLPRSYTLPREFKYQNKNNEVRRRAGGSSTRDRFSGSCYYLPSTNSSDGDVDSADNEEDTDAELKTNGIVAKCRPYVLEDGRNVAANNYPVPATRAIARSKIRPETKL